MKNNSSFRLKCFNKLLVIFLAFLPVIYFSCSKETEPEENYPDINRLDKLPSDISKRKPETDQYPPVLHSNQYENPVPLGSGVNTAGAEDSPFVLPDGNTLYFFFTPDIRVPV